MADDDVDDSAVSPPANASTYEYFDDPLYLSTSDQPFLQLLSYQFTGHNFLTWKRELYLALVAKNKEVFVDRSLKIPEKTDKKRNQWIRCDLMVMKWILNSIAKEIRETLTYVHSSKELWTELLDRYGQTNGLEVYQLKKEQSSIMQDNFSLIEYYSKLKTNWESLEAIDPIPSCSCGALDLCTCQFLKKLVARETQSKLIQLLMGLNMSYEGVKTNILSMEPLPPINKALALLQKIERQKQITDAVDVLSEATAFASVHQSDARQSDWKKPKYESNAKESLTCNYCHNIGHVKADCFKLRGCTFCGWKGHSRDTCFRLKSTGEKKGRGRPVYTPGTNTYKRTANHIGVLSDNVEIADSPLDDYVSPAAASQFHTPGAPNSTAGVDTSLMDNLVQTVMEKVMKAISDTTPAFSSANFAGPFK
ncbi:hypothetical protein RND81_03G018400 [Saponaria officinalis]|uniref:Retrotransposon Copia-like N-terminal domain-containing protein n=1 Tax=Saponaria officinalis TaxID=3572 RepID=A0AAW1M4M4_SAPOF